MKEEVSYICEHWTALWNYARGKKKTQGKICTKQKIITSNVQGKLFLSHELFSVFVIFDEKFDLFANLFHFPAKMSKRYFRISYSILTRTCVRYV